MKDIHRPNRRSFLAAGAAAAASVPATAFAVGKPHAAHAEANAGIEPFWGPHQAGISTPQQRNTCFMAFDLVTNQRDEVIALLQAWTRAAAISTGADASPPRSTDPDQPPSDDGASLGLPFSRLTITFGFGAGLFTKDGIDRYGLADRRPAALADLPKFPGDQLVPERTGGDLSVQTCADDPQVAESAIRRFIALGYGVARIRWSQNGFSAGFKPGDTPRNQMGFKDGTMNVSIHDDKAMQQFVWVGPEGPSWMRGGSYLVVRPIRIALEHWDRMKLGFQEQTVGRHKESGAPLGKRQEFEAMDFDASDADGNPVIPENAHARLASPQSNDGAQILRRAFAYDNGVTTIAERWPPWHQSVTLDAGLLFQCYQRDPRDGFTRMFQKMSRFDMLNQFTTHIGSGLFACPQGAQRGEYVGQRLFSA